MDLICTDADGKSAAPGRRIFCSATHLPHAPQLRSAECSSGACPDPPWLLLSIPSAAQILLHNASNYSKGILSEILDFVMGQGLIPADGEVWKVRRRCVLGWACQGCWRGAPATHLHVAPFAGERWQAVQAGGAVCGLGVDAQHAW